MSGDACIERERETLNWCQTKKKKTKTFTLTVVSHQIITKRCCIKLCVCGNGKIKKEQMYWECCLLKIRK